VHVVHATPSSSYKTATQACSSNLETCDSNARSDDKHDEKYTNKLAIKGVVRITPVGACACTCTHNVCELSVHTTASLVPLLEKHSACTPRFPRL
jgi:hypothetical protein